MSMKDVRGSLRDVRGKVFPGLPKDLNRSAKELRGSAKDLNHSRDVERTNTKMIDTFRQRRHSTGSRSEGLEEKNKDSDLTACDTDADSAKFPGVTLIEPQRQTSSSSAERSDNQADFYHIKQQQQAANSSGEDKKDELRVADYSGERHRGSRDIRDGLEARDLERRSEEGERRDDRDDKQKDKEDFKARKQTYRIQKKKVAKEFSTALKNKSVIIISSWLKIRSTLKNWSKYWCVIKPEVMIIYKSDKYHHWVGSVMINQCEFMIRPSSKEGFCFKIFQPYRQNIWSNKGPKGELSGSLVQPMPRDHLILRTESEEAGRCWMDALEVAQRSTLVPSDRIHSDLYGGGQIPKDLVPGEPEDDDTSGEEDVFDGKDNDDSFNTCVGDEPLVETSYSVPTFEELGEAGETTDDIEDENKSILWALLKQVRPGMDLSKVTLPTFILEPRSFLDKLADYYYHSDLLAGAAREESAYKRIKEVVKWYLSGFYKKPKGLKKPYNPIMGEMFRCMWSNDAVGSRTFYIAEQVSHHPPVSAFFVSNRKAGFAMNGCVLSKSKFYGNSTSAILDGTAILTFLKLGEEYSVNMPYVHVKGLLIGTLSVELGGTVNIRCEKTGYCAELEFKLKPFWKKSGECNFMSGKIRIGNDIISKIDGKWDQEMTITEFMDRSGNRVEDPLPEVFFEATPEVRNSRLKRYDVEPEQMEEYESAHMWQKTGEAIINADQEAATREKTLLEDEQRRVHRELKEKNEEWQPRLFERDSTSLNPNAWIYKYRDLRPWDVNTDLLQYEHNGIIKTRTRIKVPTVRTMSLMNVSLAMDKRISADTNSSRLPSIVEPANLNIIRRDSFDRSTMGSSQSEEELTDDIESKSNDQSHSSTKRRFRQYLKPFFDAQKETEKQLSSIRLELKKMNQRHEDGSLFQFRDWLLVFFVLIVSALLQKLL